MGRRVYGRGKIHIMSYMSEASGRWETRDKKQEREVANSESGNRLSVRVKRSDGLRDGVYGFGVDI